MPTNAIAVNRRANFDYEILEKYEGGLVLKGYEVKSIKTGHISLKGSFVVPKNEELFLINANIPLYQHAGKMPGYEPTASRKILVKKREIKNLLGRAQTEGLTLIPLSVYNKRGKIKLLFALAKGKKKHDKREKIKERDDKRWIDRRLKQF